MMMYCLLFSAVQKVLLVVYGSKKGWQCYGCDEMECKGPVQDAGKVLLVVYQLKK